MIRSQLNSYSGADPIWGFVALISSERYTGEAAVGIDPRVRLFAVDGRVYFAEREGDAPIGTRLVSGGLVSTTQLAHGTVQIGETSSLARLFQREPTIDRDAVELTIDLATDALLESVANRAVGMPEVFPLRHHSSGVHYWLRTAANSTALPISTVDDVVVDAVVEAPVESPVEDLHFIDELLVTEEAAVEETVIEEPVAEEPVVQEVVIEEPVAEDVDTQAALVDEVVDESAAEEAVIEEAVIEETVMDEAVTDEPGAIDAPGTAPATAAWGAELLTNPAPAAWSSAPLIKAPVVEVPVVEDLFVAPVAAFSFPRLGSFAQPVDEVGPTEVSDAAEAHVEATDIEEIHVEAVDEITIDESPTDDVPVEPTAEAETPAAEPLLAPMPTIAKLTLPTLRGVSAQEVTPESKVVVEPTLASTADDFLASLPEPVGHAPVYPYGLAESPAGLPKLSSTPTLTTDLAVADALPAPSFGEPIHNLAAVDIWEMVDVLTDDNLDGEKDLVGSGRSEKQGRSWLRSRKS